MHRMLYLTVVTLLGMFALATPSQAGFDLDDLGRLLRKQGFQARFHPEGYYTVHHGGYDYRLFPSRDGSHLNFRVNLARLEQRHHQAPQFKRVFQLHHQHNFQGQFHRDDNQLYFQHQVRLRNFEGGQFHDHLRSISRTLDQHQRHWNPQQWAGR